jgi:hypothetical protein
MRLGSAAGTPAAPRCVTVDPAPMRTAVALDAAADAAPPDRAAAMILAAPAAKPPEPDTSAITASTVLVMLRKWTRKIDL